MLISRLRRDGGTQPRAGMDSGTVTDYADAMLDGVTFPPVTVYFDGTDYWLADGFHRVKAAEDANLPEIEADIRQGSRRDAVLHSVGANAQHGLRRTNADKRRAVETLLRDSEWVQWSNVEIARRCAVHQSTVADIRNSMTFENRKSGTDAPILRKGADGRTINTANIGKPKAEQVNDTEQAQEEAEDAAPESLTPVPDEGAPQDEEAAAELEALTYRHIRQNIWNVYENLRDSMGIDVAALMSGYPADGRTREAARQLGAWLLQVAEGGIS